MLKICKFVTIRIRSRRIVPEPPVRRAYARVRPRVGGGDDKWNVFIVVVVGEGGSKVAVNVEVVIHADVDFFFTFTSLSLGLVIVIQLL